MANTSGCCLGMTTPSSSWTMCCSCYRTLTPTCLTSSQVMPAEPAEPAEPVEPADLLSLLSLLFSQQLLEYRGGCDENTVSCLYLC